MKKLLTIILAFTTFVSIAQTSKGTLFGGGTLGYSSDKYEQGVGNPDGKLTGITLAPSVGYFLSDKLAVGLNISLYSAKDNNGATEDKYSETSFGPFARWYKFTSNESFAFTAEAGLLFGASKTTPAGTPSTNGKSLDFYISPGFSYFFSSKWGLDFQLAGIRYQSQDPDTDGAATGDKSSSFVFGVSSFYPSLGFRYFLSK